MSYRPAPPPPVRVVKPAPRLGPQRPETWRFTDFAMI